MKEVELLEKDGVVQDFKLNIMKDKGLGDTIERFTSATGIKKMVDMIPGGCGCDERKQRYNELTKDWFPYKNK